MNRTKYSWLNSVYLKVMHFESFAIGSVASMAFVVITAMGQAVQAFYVENVAVLKARVEKRRRFSN